MLCYAMLCYAMLCCAVLCCAVLCCAMLCYTILVYTYIHYDWKMLTRSSLDSVWNSLRQGRRRSGALALRHQKASWSCRHLKWSRAPSEALSTSSWIDLISFEVFYSLKVCVIICHCLTLKSESMEIRRNGRPCCRGTPHGWQSPPFSASGPFLFVHASKSWLFTMMQVLGWVIHACRCIKQIYVYIDICVY